MRDTITFRRGANGGVVWDYTFADASSPAAASVAAYDQLLEATRDAYRVVGLDPTDPAFSVMANSIIRRRGTSSAVRVVFADGLA